MFRHTKKSQAAMEFLMTYGWAILVVMIAIGALSYFGVLNPDKFLPGICILPAGIACTDFKIDGSAQTVTVILRNGLGFDATNVIVSVTGCTDTAATILANDAQAQIVGTSCALTSGTKFSGDINITYTSADSLVIHKVQGSIKGKAE